MRGHVRQGVGLVGRLVTAVVVQRPETPGRVPVSPPAVPFYRRARRFWRRACLARWATISSRKVPQVMSRSRLTVRAMLE